MKRAFQTIDNEIKRLCIHTHARAHIFTQTIFTIATKVTVAPHGQLFGLVTTAECQQQKLNPELRQFPKGVGGTVHALNGLSDSSSRYYSS